MPSIIEELPKKQSNLLLKVLILLRENGMLIVLSG